VYRNAFLSSYKRVYIHICVFVVPAWSSPPPPPLFFFF
jgi:hypothetical protein